MSRHAADRLPPQLTTTVLSYAPAVVRASHARAVHNATAAPVVAIEGVAAPEKVPERPRPPKNPQAISMRCTGQKRDRAPTQMPR
jgi:hypothetical protein